MTMLSLRSPALRLGSIVGLLGGLALVAVPMFGFRGPTIYIPYTVLVLALTGLAALRPTYGRWERFGLVFTGFMVASLVMYLFIILIDNPDALSITLLGHAWRLGFLLGVGAILAAPAALMTERRSQPVANG